MRSAALLVAALGALVVSLPSAVAAKTTSQRTRVYAIGDSVMIDTKSDLRHDISGIVINADVSRQVAAGIRILQRQQRNGTIARTTVFGLGTNGTFTASTDATSDPAHGRPQARRDHYALPLLRLDSKEQPDGAQVVHSGQALLGCGVPGKCPQPSGVVHR